MRLTFRNKLLLIVAAAVVSILAGMGASTLIGFRQGRELDQVEHHLLPRLELGRELDIEFTLLRRSLQDAVAAQDPTQLETSAARKDRLLARVSAAREIISPEDSRALHHAIRDYYQVAVDISQRLLAGETGESLVLDMQAMQARQAHFEKLLETRVVLDRSRLEAAFESLHQGNERASQFRLAVGLTGLVLVLGLSFWLSRSVLGSLHRLSTGLARFGTGHFDEQIPTATTADLGNLALEANQMANALAQHALARERDDWLKEGQAGIAAVLRGEQKPFKLAESVLTLLAARVGAAAGALYLRGKSGRWSMVSQLAHEGLGKAANSELEPTEFAEAEGLVGRAAQSKELLLIEHLPEGYFRIRSGLGEAPPRVLVLLPLARRERTVGVIELALFDDCSDLTREFLRSLQEPLTMAFEASISRVELENLLAETTAQAERLVAQEEELRVSSNELQMQQEELRATNEALEAQHKALRENNASLENTRRSLQEKAEELARVSIYKSQFLANMSHELRTPLNSMLLLSHLLAENEARNLSPKQVEHLRTIHGAGEDLLKLINQVLDLAKIEAGKTDLHWERVPVSYFADFARRRFSALANDKGLELGVEVKGELPDVIVTDMHRLEGILTNLIGNAIKFTAKGRISLTIERPEPSTRFQRDGLSSRAALGFVVADTGPGIAAALHDRVFVPFEQIETSANRRYGGTGLGLAIARESAWLLGGELRLTSTPGSGSTFSCFVPEKPPNWLDSVSSEDDQGPSQALESAPPEAPAAATCLLIIEDDPVLAEQLAEIIRARRLAALTATSGKEGLRLARQRGVIGIILDVRLPDVDGWTVMERLRGDPVTRRIPVHFVTAVDKPEIGLALGAVGYLVKPVTHAELTNVVFTLAGGSDVATRDRVLVVEDDQTEGQSIAALLRNEPVEVTHVMSAEDALAKVTEGTFGCMILDLGLPDMDGLQLLEQIRARVPGQAPRVVVHTGRALTRQETLLLETYSQAVILKDARSGERLLEEIRCFVRHIKEGLPAGVTGSPEVLASNTSNVSLAGRKVLVVEDDMRTVYALSALMSGKGAEVLIAENGREALTLLDTHPNVDCVLMDIMMPEMDGYEAIRRVRADPSFEALPVIALTAKAMKGERERCLGLGANDYLTKPVDANLLLEVLSRWLDKEAAVGTNN